jgi:hypothetical protein
MSTRRPDRAVVPFLVSSCHDSERVAIVGPDRPQARAAEVRGLGAPSESERACAERVPPIRRRERLVWNFRFWFRAERRVERWKGYASEWSVKHDSLRGKGMVYSDARPLVVART